MHLAVYPLHLQYFNPFVDPFQSPILMFNPYNSPIYYFFHYFNWACAAQLLDCTCPACPGPSGLGMRNPVAGLHMLHLPWGWSKLSVCGPVTRHVHFTTQNKLGSHSPVVGLCMQSSLLPWSEMWMCSSAKTGLKCTCAASQVVEKFFPWSRAVVPKG